MQRRSNDKTLHMDNESVYNTCAMALIINVLIIILECIGLGISIKGRGWKIIAYYTQLSNIVTLISSLILVIIGTSSFSAGLRYLSSCMLTMTFLVTVFVLIPMGSSFKKLMLQSSGLYHHTLCPLISVSCYVFFEQHAHTWLIPTVLTFIYGITMLILNGMGRFDGPYPFFRVRQQSRRATALWIVVLVAVIAIISLAIAWVA